MPLDVSIKRYVTELAALGHSRLTRERLVEMQCVLEHLGPLVQQGLTGRLALTGDLWPEVDENDDDEESDMPQSERERLLRFMRAIDDAGVQVQAKEDALARLEQYFQGR